MKRRRTTWSEVRNHLKKLGHEAYERDRQRKEKRVVGRAKSFKKKLIREATPAEILLIDRLTQEHIVFKFQEIVRSQTQFRIIDFWVSRLNNTPLIVEIDGEYHKEPAQKIKDKKREDWLKQKFGCEIVRFTNEQVYTKMDEVVATIKGKHVLLQFST